MSQSYSQHRVWCECNNQMWFNQFQIAVLRLWRLQRLSLVPPYPPRRPKPQSAPSQDWGEGGGELMTLDLTSGALRRPPLHPRQCLLPQYPLRPLWLCPNLFAVREGGLDQILCRNVRYRAREKHLALRAIRHLVRNVGDVVIRSIRLGTTSQRKTSWKMENTSKNLTLW